MVAASARVLAWPVAWYIRSERDRLERQAKPLTGEVRGTLGAYFGAADLDRVRIAELTTIRVPGGGLSAPARRLGFRFPSPKSVAAIALDHVIASQVPMNSALLFHELVHVVQYRLLGGVGPFASEYVHGFLATGSYDDIPLERCAYELGSRYELGGAPFSVAEEVARRLPKGSSSHW